MVCKVCQYEKQERLPFPTNKAWRAIKKLHLVYTDVCGQTKATSLSNNRYFILFIDKYTRYCWVYFLKVKSEVAKVFRKFKAIVENQACYKLRILRLENGIENTFEKFQKFCEDAGIEHQLSNTYTSQQNGMCERKNKTVMDMSRCLLFEKKLPNQLWVEATNTFVYLLNRLPTKAMKDMTPFEGWFGFKPSVSHLKVFGCVLCFYSRYQKE